LAGVPAEDCLGSRVAMSDPAARTFSSDFKRFFVRGLAVVLPTILTLWIVVKAYQFVDSTIADPINRGVRVAMNNAAPYWEPLRTWFNPDTDQLVSAKLALGGIQLADGTILAPSNVKLPSDEVLTARLRAENIHAWWTQHWYMNLIGLIVAVVSVYIAGRLLGGYIGRKVYTRLERLITTLPVFKQVYPYVKQIVDFLFGDDKAMKFSRVVMVQYPRVGIWSMGFQTGPSFRSMEDHAPEGVSVFIPSSPTPFTGYTIIVRPEDIIEVPIGVEEALRYIVSGGVLVTEHLSNRKPDSFADLIPIPAAPAVTAAPLTPGAVTPVVQGSNPPPAIAHS
jgi:uncharacterized membrane protein